MEFVLLVLAGMAGIGAWNYFVTQRFKDRFARAFVEELKSSYPGIDGQLTVGVGAQAALVFLNTGKLRKSLTRKATRIIDRPDFKGYSPRVFDKTQKLMIDFWEKKFLFLTRVWHCLPIEIQRHITQKEDDIRQLKLKDNASEDTLDDEIAEHLGIPRSHFSALLRLDNVMNRAAAAAG